MQNKRQKEMVKRIIKYRSTKEDEDFEYLLKKFAPYCMKIYMEKNRDWAIKKENHNYLNYIIAKQVIDQYDLERQNEVEVTTFAYIVAESRIIDEGRAGRKKFKNEKNYELKELEKLGKFNTDNYFEEEQNDDYRIIEKIIKNIKEFIENEEFPKVKIKNSKKGFLYYQDVYIAIIEKQLFEMFKNKESIKDREFEYRNYLRRKYIESYALELNVSQRNLQQQIKRIDDYYKDHKKEFKNSITIDFLENLIKQRKYKKIKRKKSLEF